MPTTRARLRRWLLNWYALAKRDLPWRRSRDPYAIWLSEIMLQQTRVSAAVPYYERFLARFPTLEALAAASESELLTAWSGLGYYRRARNLQRAAQHMQGGFPTTYESIRALPGVGEYTAAAVASIAFGLPHAVVDGNVLRVLSRLYEDHGDIAESATRKRLQAAADALLDERHPGEYNQALMELGATICLPKRPQCLLCPWQPCCSARRSGSAEQLPVRARRAEITELRRVLLWIERDGKLLLWQRPANSGRMAGFWELPEDLQLPPARVLESIGSFTHAMTRYRFCLEVRRATVDSVHPPFYFVDVKELQNMPVSTITRKATRLLSARL